jgi:hypothetical protein
VAAGRRFHHRGAHAVTVTAAAAAAGTRLVDGPVRLVGWSLAAANSAGFNNTNTQAAPVAGTTIASVIVPQGFYTVNWRVAVGGTTGGPEQDNFALFNGVTQVAVSENGSSSGTDVQQNAQQIAVGVGGATISIQAIGNATAGSTYRASLALIEIENGYAEVHDAGQLVGIFGQNAGIVDTRYFGPDGFYIGTELHVQTLLGIVSGVVYVRDVLPDD